MKKLVVKLDIHDTRDKKKVIKAISGISCIDSISVDMKDGKLTVIGDVDPYDVVRKLKKTWHTEIVSVGEEKKPEEKKPEEKKPVDAMCNYPCIRQQHYVVYSCEENPNSCGIL